MTEKHCKIKPAFQLVELMLNNAKILVYKDLFHYDSLFRMSELGQSKKTQKFIRSKI